MTYITITALMFIVGLGLGTKSTIFLMKREFQKGFTAGVSLFSERTMFEKL